MLSLDPLFVAVFLTNHYLHWQVNVHKCITKLLLELTVNDVKWDDEHIFD